MIHIEIVHCPTGVVHPVAWEAQSSRSNEPVDKIKAVMVGELNGAFPRFHYELRVSRVARYWIDVDLFHLSTQEIQVTLRNGEVEHRLQDILLVVSDDLPRVA